LLIDVRRRPLRRPLRHLPFSNLSCPSETESDFPVRRFCRTSKLQALPAGVRFAFWLDPQFSCFVGGLGVTAALRPIQSLPLRDFEAGSLLLGGLLHPSMLRTLPNSLFVKDVYGPRMHPHRVVHVLTPPFPVLKSISKGFEPFDLIWPRNFFSFRLRCRPRLFLHMPFPGPVAAHLARNFMGIVDPGKLPNMNRAAGRLPPLPIRTFL